MKNTLNNNALVGLLPKLRKHAAKASSETSDPDDLVQEALLAITENEPDFPLAYGKRVITNLARRPPKKTPLECDLRLLVRDAPSAADLINDRRTIARLSAAFESLLIWGGAGQTQLIRGTLADTNVLPLLKDLVFCTRVIGKLPVSRTTKWRYKNDFIEALRNEVEAGRADHQYQRPISPPVRTADRADDGDVPPVRLKAPTRPAADPETAPESTGVGYRKVKVVHYDRTFLYGIRTLLWLPTGLSFSDAEAVARETWDELRGEYAEAAATE